MSPIRSSWAQRPQKTTEKKIFFIKMQSNRNYICSSTNELHFYGQNFISFFTLFFFLNINRYQFNEQPNKMISSKRTLAEKTIANLFSIRTQTTIINPNGRWEKIAVQKSWKPKLRDYFISLNEMCIGLQFILSIVNYIRNRWLQILQYKN